MPLQQSFLEAVLCSSFGTPAFAREASKDVCVDQVAESNGALATVGTARFSEADVTDIRALYRTLYGCALQRTSAADLSVIESIKEHKDFTVLPQLYPFQCPEESDIQSPLSNMHPSVNFAWDIQAMVLRNPVLPSAKKQSSPATFDGDITLVPTALSGSASETTGTAVRATKFDFVHDRHWDVLFRRDQKDDPNILLCNMSDAHVYLVEAFSVYEFDHARGTLSVTTTAAASLDESEEASSATPRVLDKDAYVVLMNRRNRI